MKKVFDFISRILSWVCFCLVICFTVLVAVQVISRYVFNSPTTWTELVARYLFVWTMLLYMPVVYRDKANAAFTLIHEKVRISVSRWFDFITDLFVLFMSCYLVFWGSQFCMRMSSKVITGLGVGIKSPMNAVYLAIPVGSGLLALYAIERIVNEIPDLMGKRR